MGAPHYTEDEKRIVEALLADGASFPEAARTIGRSVTGVALHWKGQSQWTQKMGGEFGVTVKKFNHKMKRVQWQ